MVNVQQPNGRCIEEGPVDSRGRKPLVTPAIGGIHPDGLAGTYMWTDSPYIWMVRSGERVCSPIGTVPTRRRSAPEAEVGRDRGPIGEFEGHRAALAGVALERRPIELPVAIAEIPHA